MRILLLPSLLTMVLLSCNSGESSNMTNTRVDQPSNSPCLSGGYIWNEDCQIEFRPCPSGTVVHSVTGGIGHGNSELSLIGSVVAPSIDEILNSINEENNCFERQSDYPINVQGRYYISVNKNLVERSMNNLQSRDSLLVDAHAFIYRNRTLINSVNTDISVRNYSGNWIGTNQIDLEHYMNCPYNESDYIAIVNLDIESLIYQPNSFSLLDRVFLNPPEYEVVFYIKDLLNNHSQCSCPPPDISNPSFESFLNIENADPCMFDNGHCHISDHIVILPLPFCSMPYTEKYHATMVNHNSIILN